VRAPMPLVPPVTTATLPSNKPTIFFSYTRLMHMQAWLIGGDS
jgi:hypothetical protein